MKKRSHIFFGVAYHLNHLSCRGMKLKMCSVCFCIKSLRFLFLTGPSPHYHAVAETTLG